MKHIVLILFVFSFILVFPQEEKQAFIPEIIKQFPNVRDVAISPSGNEIMFTAQNISGTISGIIQVSKNNNIWSSPKIAHFSGQFFDLEPFFSPDGLKLYYASKRPLDSTSTNEKDFDIWYVERTNISSEWSEPKNLGYPVNSKYDEFYPSVALNGTIYFTRDNPTLNNKDDIYVSQLKKGLYTSPEALPNTINTTGYEYNAFIAPDESYIIFGSYNRTNGYGSGDLYISLNTKNGWQTAENLGSSINTNKMDYCPFVDVTTNILYYTSKVDNTKVTFEKPLTITELFEELNRYDNGLSRLYEINIEALLKTMLKK